MSGFVEQQELVAQIKPLVGRSRRLQSYQLGGHHAEFERSSTSFLCLQGDRTGHFSNSCFYSGNEKSYITNIEQIFLDLKSTFFLTSLEYSK
jgi:hypothetical protein